ncbi:hypothetical protein M422DRAFT_23652 [Sphaerobolus stellatus SS14]|nr:hypothetical protein M422DRAFT_23652 [Sphaerobolus stellatus SS14]
MSTIFVIGAGPKIGLAVPKLFVENGFKKVGLASRSKANLDALASQIPSSAEVTSVEIDASDLTAVQKGLDKLKETLGQPDVVVYNASSLFIPPKPLLDLTVEELEAHLRVTLTAGLVIGQWSAKNTNTGGSAPPAVLFTGGGLGHQPRPNFAGLAIGKAALLNLTKAFRVEQPDIHWAVVTVKGRVDGGDEYYSSAVIAKEYWKLYQQKKEEWEVEIHH